jgi:DNA-directed RNA polymerase subunit alpha
MTGVYEDVTDIVLNLKNLLFVLHDVSSAELRIRRDKKGPVLAADIQHGPEVDVVNPDLLIATLTEDMPFNADLLVRKGRGYMTAEENSAGDNEIGVIWLDASFSPVSRVRYKTENTRVGQRTNYDRLVLEIWTNGTVRPELALVEAAKILRRHLNPFIQYAEIGYQLQRDVGVSGEEIQSKESTEELRQKFDLPINALELSVRALNCLEAENIKLVGDLAGRSEAELLRVRNFGKTTLGEIKEKLERLGLQLGMEVPALVKSAGSLQ